MIIAVALMATATLQAQTYNDSVRTHTWSVYASGGLSLYHGVRSELFYDAQKTMAPDLNLGVKYNIKPWVRVGVNTWYTMLKSTNKGISSSTTKQDNFMIGDYSTTLNTKIDRLQNRNNMHLLGVDMNANFNILDIWHKRKSQWVNLYAGVGVGYVHGWNRNSQTCAYYESAVAKGDGYYNVYNHTYMKSTADKSQLNTLFVPMSLSLEFDVARQLTVGAMAQYKYLPVKKDLIPRGIYSAGVVIRYNLVKSKSKLQQNQINRLYSQIDSERKNCLDEQASIQRRTDDKNKLMANRIAEQERSIVEKEKVISVMKKDNIGTIVYFENDSWELSENGKEQLSHLIAQLKENQSRTVTLIGSSSMLGSKARNQNLSDKRCGVVKKYLLSQGMREDQLKSVLSLGDHGMTVEPDCRRVIIIVQ